MTRYIQAEEDITTLGNPPAGSQALVFDSTDHQLKRKLPDGTLVNIEGGTEIPSGATFPTTGYDDGDFYFNTTLGVIARHNGGTAGDDTDWDYVDLSTISGTLPIAHGGTGATTGPDALTALGAASTTHADTHHTGGTDELAPTDIGAAAATHAHAGTDITSGTVGSARLPDASGTTAGIVPTTSGSATNDKLRVKADGTLEWYTPALDEVKVSKLYESDGGAAAVEVDAAGDVTVHNDLTLGSDTSTVADRTHVFWTTPQEDCNGGWEYLDSWASGSDLTGTSAPVSVSFTRASMAYIKHTSIDKFFRYKTYNIPSGTMVTGRVFVWGNSSCRVGIRLDNGSDDCFYEIYLYYTGSALYIGTRYQINSGGITTDDTAVSWLPCFTLLSIQIYTFGIYPRYTMDTPEGISVNPISSGFSPTRVGFLYESVQGWARGEYDWLYRSK